jgi:hypothetical protein
MAALTLQNITDYVRTHMDLDATELPPTLVNYWATEATTKIHHYKQRQPWLENSWSLAVVGGTSEYSFSSITDGTYTPAEIISVIRPTFKLQWIGRDEAERRFVVGTSSTTGQPIYFQTWSQKLRLFPTPTVSETYTIRGYRSPIDWVAAGAGSSPDLPVEFHDCVRIYVLASAYLQQEDSEMSGNYFNMFDDEMKKLSKNYGEAPPAEPFILGGGPRVRVPQGRLAYPFE